MRPIALLIALLFALLTLASCATISEEECRAGDWAAIGLEDGKAGRSAAYLANHAEACAEVGVTPDQAAWEAARLKGLAFYCTPDNAYALGRSGREMNAVCPAAISRALARANDWGLEYHRLAQDLEDLREERSSLRDLLASLQGDELSDEDKALRRQARARLERVEDAIFDLQFDLRRYDRLPAGL